VLALPLCSWAEPKPELSSPGIWPEYQYDWYYNPSFHPSWLSAEQARTALLEAAKQWEACGIKLRYQGETRQAVGKMDGRNVVGWNLTLPKQLRGVTLGQARLGQLVERDIAFRPDRLEFQRHPRLLQKVMTHEFGHAIGLTHSAQCDDVMTLAADCPGQDPETLPLTLTPHDLERCTLLYPDKKASQ
jgi:hypothetical protein